MWITEGFGPVQGLGLWAGGRLRQQGVLRDACKPESVTSRPGPGSGATEIG